VKTLILIRHAKARKDIPDIADIDRPLAERADEQIAAIGKRLKKYKVMPELVYSSPAKRALGTAECISQIIDFPVERVEVIDSMYQPSVSGLLKIIKKAADSAGSLMLFGHNMEFFDLANYLAVSPIDKFPTCGALCLQFDVNSWSKISKNEGKILFFECP